MRAVLLLAIVLCGCAGGPSGGMDASPTVQTDTGQSAPSPPTTASSSASPQGSDLGPATAAPTSEERSPDIHEDTCPDPDPPKSSPYDTFVARYETRRLDEREARIAAQQAAGTMLFTDPSQYGPLRLNVTESDTITMHVRPLSDDDDYRMEVIYTGGAKGAPFLYQGALQRCGIFWEHNVTFVEPGEQVVRLHLSHENHFGTYPIEVFYNVSAR